MKQIHPLALLFLFFCSSCGGPNKPDLSKESSKSETNGKSTSSWRDTKYEYTDSTGASLIIENGFPRGNKYADLNGNEYARVIFWTRITNETDSTLEFNIDFPVEVFEPPWLPGKYYQLLIPPDTMTIDKEALYDYGMNGLKSFIDNSLHKPSSLKRTINPKESSAFYVVILCKINEAASGTLRTGFSLKGQDFFYSVSLIKGPSSMSLIGEKEIHCGSINLNNLVLRK